MSYTLWLFSHGKSPFVLGKPSINGSFSIAMLNNQMVLVLASYSRSLCKNLLPPEAPPKKARSFLVSKFQCPWVLKKPMKSTNFGWQQLHIFMVFFCAKKSPVFFPPILVTVKSRDFCSTFKQLDKHGGV